MKIKRTRITFYNHSDAIKVIARNRHLPVRLMRMPAVRTVEIIGEMDQTMWDFINWLDWQSTVTFDHN